MDYEVSETVCAEGLHFSASLYVGSTLVGRQGMFAFYSILLYYFGNDNSKSNHIHNYVAQ